MVVEVYINGKVSVHTLPYNAPLYGEGILSSL